MQNLGDPEARWKNVLGDLILALGDGAASTAPAVGRATNVRMGVV